jgi:3-deoxy-D-manno-octulosonate 8-phosphate phosphatase (KDO 8-P phosphatase)
MNQVSESVLAKVKQISHLILDVDGVMTDGRIVYDDDGRELKFFDVKDGHGLKLLMRTGIEVILLTGRQSRVVDHRAKDLGIRDVYQGSKNKIQILEQILREKGLAEERLACMGDDLTDIPLVRRCGFSAAPADASEYVKQIVDYVTKKEGGRGAVREVCELILHAQGTWREVVERYSMEEHG